MLPLVVLPLKTTSFAFPGVFCSQFVRNARVTVTVQMFDEVIVTGDSLRRPDSPVMPFQESVQLQFL